MNKFIATLIIAAGFLVCYAEDANTAPRTLIEKTGTTQYVGIATATGTGGSPNISNAVWSITRFVVNGDTTEITHAFNTNAVGDQVTQNYWTNRVGATYK